MAQSLRLKIFTPFQLVLDEEVEEVVSPGTLGEFGVLPGHVPFITTLTKGELRYLKSGKENRMNLDGGLVEVKDDIVKVMTEAVSDSDSSS